MTYALIRSHDGKAEERINFADLYNTWSREFDLSQTFKVSFTMRYLPGFEYVFNLAKIQAEVLFNGQVYKIKEVEPITNEQGVVTNKITAVNALIDKLRNLRLPEANKDSDSSSSDSSSDNPQPGTVIQRAQADQTYSLDSVMHQFFDNNDQGIRYELHGQFIDQPAQAQGSCFDYLTSNLAAFGGYWIPDGNTLKIYDLASLTHNTGETFRYLYHSPNVDIQSSSADMVNSVEYQAGKMEKTVTNSDDTPVTKNAQGVIDYARSWLGVPYILGGRTTAGTDCAGFVHFVYAKFGIDIGWTTWSQEPSFHEVSTPQTGDVGFYGSHGNPYHICLFLDANTIIFEPQPGEVCKEEPASWYYPSWVARNDQMAAIVAGGGSSDSGGSSSSTTEFYQLNGTYKNQDSIDKYDEHRGEVQTLDGLYDQNAVNDYLDNHLQVEPATTMTWTHKDDFHYHLGDSVHTIDPELNVDSDMIIFSYITNDFNENSDSTINFNNTGKAMKDINAILLKSITNINNSVGNISYNGATGGRKENHFSSMNMVLLSPDEMAKLKKFTES